MVAEDVFVNCYNFNHINLAKESNFQGIILKVHKIEIFFGFDFEICIISLLVM